MPPFRQKRSIAIGLFILSLTASIPCIARGLHPVLPRGEHVAPEDQPWLTGPLLAPSGHVIPTGHWNIEPYFYTTTNHGIYDSHWNTFSTPKFYNVLTQLPIQYGFFNKFDIQFTPQFSWNHTDGASSWEFNDLPFGVDYQLVRDEADKWWPAIRLTVKMNIPAGKYQHLHARKKGTDIGGSGSLAPGAAIAMSRLFHIHKKHFFNLRSYFSYTATSPVHVQGLNAYGGGSGTRGKVYPGNSYNGIIGMEYSLTQNWALAMDIQYAHNNRTRFKGRTTNPVGLHSSEQLSLAPAFEYNWSPNLGLIAGAWFSVAGRNTGEFASGVVALNIYK